MLKYDSVNGTKVVQAADNGHFILRAGELFDGEAKQSARGMDIEINGGRISAVGRRGTLDPALPVEDFSDRFVMPGLIEAHLHLSGMQTPEPYQRYFENPDLRLIRALRHAEVLLSNGFTSVRELGGKGRGVSLREAVEKGLMKGPYILSSIEYLSPTGGHGDWPVLPYDFVKETSLRSVLVDGADECVLAVRKLLREKADFVKIVTSTGSFGQPYDDMKFRMCFSVGEIKAMAEEAHGQGKLIASHSVGSAGIRRAVECGIDTLEHCFFNYEKDPGLLDVIAESGAVVTPTFCIIYWLGEWEEKRHNDPRGAKNFYDNVRRHQKFVRDAFEAGIPIACGTDETGMHGVGRSAEEYAFMAEAGVPNYGILWGATSVAARALGIQDATGTIAAGKKADILVLNKSPLDDISVFRSRSGIELVMQGR